MNTTIDTINTANLFTASVTLTLSYLKKRESQQSNGNGAQSYISDVRRLYASSLARQTLKALTTDTTDLDVIAAIRADYTATTPNDFDDLVSVTTCTLAERIGDDFADCVIPVYQALDRYVYGEKSHLVNTALYSTEYDDDGNENAVNVRIRIDAIMSNDGGINASGNALLIAGFTAVLPSKQKQALTLIAKGRSYKDVARAIYHKDDADAVSRVYRLMQEVRRKADACNLADYLD